MNQKKRRKKTGDSKIVEQIAPALIPAPVLTAVPRTPSPRPPPGRPLGAAARIFCDSFSPPGRAMGEVVQDGDDGAFSDPESSLYDFQLMESAGYPQVGFGTWPSQYRRNRGDQDRISTPPFVRKYDTVSHFSQRGDVYQSVLDGEEEGLSESDLYPLSARGKSPRRKGEDAMSMDRTQRDVRDAMQAVHDMPSDETMLKLSAGRPVSSSFPGSSTSGRGTMRKAHSASGRLSSRGSHTPRDAASFSLEMEIHHLKGENEHLNQEVVNLRKVAAAIRVGDEEGAETLMRNMQLDELKEENEVLKSTVGRLNQELSRYQAKFRPLSDDDRSKLQGLPSQGPVPSWLINKRYLAPLFLAYDDLIAEKEEVTSRCQEELQALKQRAEEVVRENQRYQLQGGRSGGGGVGLSDWQELQEQARLVLEENQVLMEQLEVQHNRIKDLCATHTQDMSRLTKKVTVSETEREEVERELEETKMKFKDIKHRHDNMLLEAGSHMTVQDHINTVADLKKSVTEEKEMFEKEKEKIANKLKASEEERRQQTLATIEREAENKQLKAEIRALHKAIRRTQNKMLILQKAVQQSENKELLTQKELATVIRIVEKTALERDTAFKVVKEQQKDCKNTVDQMVGNSVVMGKMEEKLKEYKLRASSKLQTVADRLKEQDDSFNRKRQEYEHEIRHLRVLLKEKEGMIAEMEGVKKGVEQDLENMWQAAHQENTRLKEVVCNSAYKLQQHASLKGALQEEERMEQLLTFSE
ncbi:centrosomal protein of 89 kDa-like isoform X2 [Babylonia areolata]|uniref:centrosomal protein of 89 kDa-like isoform X2 n=1 Tax=Babylonia areolata TaxID=304850 RepID=UPI003FD0BD6B